MKHAKHPPTLYSPGKRTILKLLLLGILILLIGASATVPFLWESKTLWYKFGFDKTLLQGGKIAGLTASVLLLVQIILVQHLTFLERIFGLDHLISLHRKNGFLILCLVMLHIGLVLVPEGIDNLPIGWKFWPELVGAAVFLLLVPLVLTAALRKKLPYHIWLKFHRPTGYLLCVGILVHILYVSDSFDNTVPRYTLLSLFTALMLAVFWAQTRRLIH